MSDVLAMFTERPYVVAFLVSFVVIATAERGWPRMALWLVSGAALGWLMEFSSTRNGFPFGHYTYHESTFDGELSAVGVPIFASLSFAFLTYFGYSAARVLLGGVRLWRTGRTAVRPYDDGGEPAAGPSLPSGSLEGSLRSAPHPTEDGLMGKDWQILLLAAVITTWVDTVIDPVSLLGRHWFLGDLYHYREDGVHFGVPLSNYAGWLFTSLLIVFVNQQFDALLQARGMPARGFALPFRPAWALGAIVGNFAFMISVTAYLIASDGAPGEPLWGILASGVALSASFVVGAALVVWRGASGEGQDHGVELRSTGPS